MSTTAAPRFDAETIDEIVKCWIRWRYAAKIDKYHGVIDASGGEWTPDVEEAHAGFIEAFEHLDAFRAGDIPDEVARELAYEEITQIDTVALQHGPTYAREQIDKAVFWAGVLNSVGWPEPMPAEGGEAS
jgi:hypothetical protein